MILLAAREALLRKSSVEDILRGLDVYWVRFLVDFFGKEKR